MTTLMTKLFFSVLVIFIMPSHVFAQKIVRTEGSAQVELTRDKSRQEIEKQVKELAIVNALEKAFGRVIIQGNSTYISNINTGEKTETNSVFNTIANTSVKGEVLKVIREKYSNVKGEKIINGEKVPVTDIRCDITIKARELVAPPVEFSAFPLKCTNINCRNTRFKDNDDLYLYFKSPVSGYLTVYIDDGTTSSRLLPYRNMPAQFENSFPVKADREYILFSANPEFNYFGDNSIVVDEYKLVAEKKEDINRLFIIFSKSPLNKPYLKKDINKDILSDDERQNNWSVPDGLKSEDFQRWLIRNRSFRKENMQVKIIDITITK